MRCPHCQATLKYRERGKKTCSKCKKPFAFEPKDGALRLNDLAFKKLGRKLSAEGQVRYTVDQLRHALAWRQHRLTPKFAGCSPVGWLIGWIKARLGQPSRPPAPRGGPAPISRLQCIDQITRRWQQIYRELPEGLINPEAEASFPVNQPPLANLRAVLVCPDPAIRRFLAANGLPARLGLGIVPATPPFDVAATAMIDYLRARPTLPVLLLHDASPDGCLLASVVRQTFKLADNRALTDLGLRPNASTDDRFWVATTPHATARTRELLQRPDVARRLAGRLSPTAQQRFEAGLICPLAAMPPAKLLNFVTRAVEQAPAGPFPVASAPAADPARAKAQAVGFLTWPEAAR